MRLVDRLRNNDGELIPINDMADEYYTYHGGNIRTNYFDKAYNALKQIAISKTGNDLIYLKRLINNFEEIIKAIPSEIPDLIIKLTTGISNLTLNDDNLKSEIEVAFNYSGFRSSAKASWFADRFEIKACLYCNAQFALAIGRDGSKKKLLFQFDHFYSKSHYPFLSLTFGNLIPSCSSCNISKSKIKYSIESHIHPFYEDASSMLEFYIDTNNILEYLLDNRDYKLLIPKIRYLNPKIISQCNSFGIENIIEKHTDIVEELILKSRYYNESRREELQNEFSILNLSDSLIDRFVLGNYSLESEINKRPLSKLSMDIGKQLKLI